MDAKLLIAGVAMATLVAGASSARTSSMSGGNYAAPADPIPYAQMDTYTASRASHSTRHHATQGGSGGMSGDMATPAAGASGSSGDTGMNNSSATSNGSMSSGTAPGGAMSGGSMSSGSTTGGAMSGGSMSSGTPADSTTPSAGDQTAQPGSNPPH